MNIEVLKEDIDRWLSDYFNNKGNFNKTIYESMRYSLEVGGKRIRPILMILTYSLYKDNYEEILPCACALEMIHTYSLIHDDLPCMDNDSLRRGKPTNHIVFGEAMALLAGDGLLNEAFNIILNEALVKGETWLKAGSIIGKSSGVEGMIGGQVVDILSTNKAATEEELYYIHNKKTGELIKGAILSGAVLGKAEERELNILKEYGEKLGLAFQIKDDILDIVGNTATLGKSVNKDSDQNKTTFIKIYGLDKCKEMMNSITEECIALLNNINADTTNLKNLTLFLLKRDY
ncbi:polyprenyl synthetase family protein [Clostridium sp. MSJ-11]|uniref:Polyprenyl synthetase family protein n=1 Tax=Clostridium mobile TaxID=2841512 RepID=A0ABS6ECT8_9CLOT|nr:farnesyl diphosphate synthase [Clostridium mobile]MBU5482937.1 polyprenyl synthetase family protein [Clostridium mobile]